MQNIGEFNISDKPTEEILQEILMDINHRLDDLDVSVKSKTVETLKKQEPLLQK